MDVTLHQATDLEQLRQMSRQERGAKQRDRYRAVLLALEGQGTEAIMRILNRSKNFVQRWVYAYRDRGLPAIRPKPQSGRCEPRSGAATSIRNPNAPLKGHKSPICNPKSAIESPRPYPTAIVSVNCYFEG